MAKINTRITLDKTAAKARIKAANNRALTIVGNQVVKDANRYVPVDQHTLEESGITNSDKKAVDGKYMARWDTPYAQYLWHGDVMYGNPTTRTYGPEKLKFTAAMARMEWAKYAKEVYGKQWKQVYQKALGMELAKS